MIGGSVIAICGLNSCTVKATNVNYSYWSTDSILDDKNACIFDCSIINGDVKSKIKIKDEYIQEWSIGSINYYFVDNGDEELNNVFMSPNSTNELINEYEFTIPNTKVVGDNVNIEVYLTKVCKINFKINDEKKFTLQSGHTTTYVLLNDKYKENSYEEAIVSITSTWVLDGGDITSVSNLNYNIQIDPQANAFEIIDEKNVDNNHKWKIKIILNVDVVLAIKSNINNLNIVII